MIIENKVKYYRLAKNLTQLELANLVGISETHLQNIEYGKARPNIEIALRLSDSLDISVEDLFLLVVDINPNK